MKTSHIILILIVLVAMISCNKEEEVQTAALKKIEFSTDKNEYHDLEDIVIKFHNNTSSYIGVNWCRLYYLERFEDDEWKSMGGPPCPFDGSFIVYKPNETFRDTIYSNWLDKGKYRFATFNLRLDTTNCKVYSNEFDIADFSNFIN